MSRSDVREATSSVFTGIDATIAKPTRAGFQSSVLPNRVTPSLYMGFLSNARSLERLESGFKNDNSLRVNRSCR